ncbi:MAG: hypothetical protein HYW48_09540 [Deltaproteobacteria bacterium]|nr:hypothetical protein [Deltaproteobacteria bacterium]
MSRYLSILLAVFVLVAACSPQQAPPARLTKKEGLPPLADQEALTEQASQSKTAVEGGKDIEDIPTDIRMDPSTARATIAKEITYSPSDVFNNPNYTFPEVAITKTSAGFIQLLRCNNSYKFTTLTGQSLDQIKGKPSELQDMKDAWLQAINDYRNCKIVADYVSEPVYQDLAAPSGDYYYIINPCLNALKSKTNKEACSYRLEMSDPFGFENLFEKDLRDKAVEISRIQAALMAKIEEVRNLADLLELRIRYCENYYATTETEKQWKVGMIMLGSGGLGYAIGSSFGGPNMGVMLGQFTMMATSSVLTQKLNLGPQMNTCLISEEKHAENLKQQAQTGMLKEKDRDRAIVAYRELNKHYSVPDILERLNELSKTDYNPQDEINESGLIERDIQRMQQALAEMNEIDQRVVLADDAIAQGNKLADEKMKETFGKGLPQK